MYVSCLSCYVNIWGLFYKKEYSQILAALSLKVSLFALKVSLTDRGCKSVIHMKDHVQ
jgi:hypothetical protein